MKSYFFCHFGNFFPLATDFSSRESGPRRAEPTLPLPHRRASPDPHLTRPSPFPLSKSPNARFSQLTRPHPHLATALCPAFPRAPPISVPASRDRAGPSRPCLCPTAGLAQTPTHPTPSPSYTHRKSLNTPDNYLLGKNRSLDLKMQILNE